MGSIVADMKQPHSTNFTLVVAETAGRDVLFSGTKRACDSLNYRTDINAPQLDVICIDPTQPNIQTAIKGMSPGAIVVAGIEAVSGVDTALALSKTINAAGAMLAVAEQSVGSPQSVFSAGQILSLVHHGAMAVFREYDFIAEDTVLQLLIEYIRRSKVKAILIGDPARRLKGLLDEVKLEWADPDNSMVYRPEVTFRVACALTQVPALNGSLNTREKVAREGFLRGWLPYNIEDARKAIGSLTRVWDLHTRTLSMLPHEARRRGFPNPDEADILFDFIERIDTDERVFTSASGTQFDILYISEI